jgi:hypothetical protein
MPGRKFAGVIAVLTLASACGTPATVVTIAPTTTTSAPAVAVPADLAGKSADVVEQQLKALGFTRIRHLGPDGNELPAVDSSWKVVGVDGAGYSLSRDALLNVLVTKAPSAPPETKVSQPPVVYKNCAAAKAAGAAPLHRGDPGYRTALDPDKDGIACN